MYAAMQQSTPLNVQDGRFLWQAHGHRQKPCEIYVMYLRHAKRIGVDPLALRLKIT